MQMQIVVQMTSIIILEKEDMLKVLKFNMMYKKQKFLKMAHLQLEL